MSDDARDEVLVELDQRRRVYLTKVGNRSHTRYLVRTERDGTMIFIWRRREGGRIQGVTATAR